MPEKGQHGSSSALAVFTESVSAIALTCVAFWPTDRINGMGYSAGPINESQVTRGESQECICEWVR